MPKNHPSSLNNKSIENEIFLRVKEGEIVYIGRSVIYDRYDIISQLFPDLYFDAGPPFQLYRCCETEKHIDRHFVSSFHYY